LEYLLLLLLLHLAMGLMFCVLLLVVPCLLLLNLPRQMLGIITNKTQWRVLQVVCCLCVINGWVHPCRRFVVGELSARLFEKV